MAHSTLASAALFLLADLIARQRTRPVTGSTRRTSCRTQRGWRPVFVTAVTVAGLPPLSGFVGKLMVLEAAWSTSVPS